jgi:hypothetical protein
MDNGAWWVLGFGLGWAWGAVFGGIVGFVGRQAWTERKARAGR